MTRSCNHCSIIGAVDNRRYEYPEIIYPLDYGYLKNTTGGDGNEIEVWLGSLQVSQLVGIVCTVDTLKSYAEVKLLVGCTDREVDKVGNFYSKNDYISSIVIKRGVNVQ